MIYELFLLFYILHRDLKHFQLTDKISSLFHTSVEMKFRKCSLINSELQPDGLETRQKGVSFLTIQSLLAADNLIY